MDTSDGLAAELSAVVAFLDKATLRSTVAELELALVGCGVDEIPEVVATSGVTEDLLRSAVAARETFGKINDVIHAAAIALSLPHLLEPGEKLVRPSLAAGNTPDRLFGVETSRRIAEFKFARWDGHDGGRQKATMKDLARLAADKSERIPELYVVGERPIRWLKSTKSSVRMKMKGHPG